MLAGGFSFLEPLNFSFSKIFKSFGKWLLALMLIYFLQFCCYVLTSHSHCDCLFFVVQVSVEEQKRFFDLLAIPGCFIMLLHCTMIKLVTASIVTGVSDWITTEVSTVNIQCTLKYMQVIFLYICFCINSTRGSNNSNEDDKNI